MVDRSQGARQDATGGNEVSAARRWSRIRRCSGCVRNRWSQFNLFVIASCATRFGDALASLELEMRNDGCCNSCPSR
jgi:hypothetical protein